MGGGGGGGGGGRKYRTDALLNSINHAERTVDSRGTMKISPEEEINKKQKRIMPIILKFYDLFCSLPTERGPRRWWWVARAFCIFYPPF